MHANQYNSIWQYNSISDQPSDREAKFLDKVLHKAQEPYKLINRLPFDISVIQEFRYTGKSVHAGILPSTGQMQLSYDSISDGDLLHFMDKNQKFFVCPSHAVVKRQGTLFVGGVISAQQNFKRDYHPGGDMSSINVYNLLPWPLLIKKGGQPVMYIDANIDLGNKNHHGDLTVAPGVYFDDLNMGINVGTLFEVFLDGTKDRSIVGVMGGNISDPLIKLYTFYISDIDEANIFIGGVNPAIDLHEATGASVDINYVNVTGRSIYRLGENRLPFALKYKDSMAVLAKNAGGTDMHRNSFNKDNTYKYRSTNPSARYKQISGGNVVCSQYL